MLVANQKTQCRVLLDIKKRKIFLECIMLGVDSFRVKLDCI